VRVAYEDDLGEFSSSSRSLSRYPSSVRSSASATSSTGNGCGSRSPAR